MGVRVIQQIMMFCSMSVALLVIAVVAQTEAQLGHDKCGSSNCVILSSCPAFLKLVLQMKSGSHAAKQKVLSSQCGFEKSLPKVCCPGLVDDLVTVLLGEHTIGNHTDGANPEEFRIRRTTKHKQFNRSTFTNDIAIVELEREVSFKTGIQPVCLPSHTPRLVREEFVSEHAHVAGWGRTSWRGSRSKELLQAILTVLSNKDCREKFAGFKDVDIADSKLCAGDRNDAGACLGDSGGPLVTLEKSDDGRYRYHLIGIVSSGYSKCHTIKGFPDVYTRVTYFDQWIRDNIK